jgi:hypothetical protein
MSVSPGHSSTKSRSGCQPLSYDANIHSSLPALARTFASPSRRPAMCSPHSKPSFPGRMGSIVPDLCNSDSLVETTNWRLCGRLYLHACRNRKPFCAECQLTGWEGRLALRGLVVDGEFRVVVERLRNWPRRALGWRRFWCGTESLDINSVIYMALSD